MTWGPFPNLVLRFKSREWGLPQDLPENLMCVAYGGGEKGTTQYTSVLKGQLASLPRPGAVLGSLHPEE